MVKHRDLEDNAEDASVLLITEMTRRATHRGSDVRLDTNDLMKPSAWPRRHIDPSRWEWKTVTTWQWTKPGHITELEARAVLSMVRWRLRSSAHLRL
eukprot:3238433-Karenia_brevis.AAC.1